MKLAHMQGGIGVGVGVGVGVSVAVLVGVAVELAPPPSSSFPQPLAAERSAARAIASGPIECGIFIWLKSFPLLSAPEDGEP
jgi:hypothetical protein